MHRVCCRPAAPFLTDSSRAPRGRHSRRAIGWSPSLQQEPTAPAFLLTVDAQTRTLTVRSVSATPEAGRSYELWLISKRFPAPRSLGTGGRR